MNKLFDSSVKRAVVASVATVVAMFAAQSNAATSDVPSVKVRYDDLDLRTTQGAHTLYRRIVAAAEKVCPASGSRELNRLAVAHDCQAAAVSRAVQDVNSPQLAAVYAERVRHG